jgi:glucose-specific phosphotransferase system IIA component
MLFGLNNRKNANALPGVVYAPQDGEVKPLAEMPDQIFADKVLGDGVCLLPINNKVYSPVSGIVDTIPETNHAIGLIADDGAEIMIHIGVDTVDMNGSGFSMKVKPGQHVKVGQFLCEADLGQIKAAGHPIHTAMVVSNGNEYRVTETYYGKVTAGSMPAFSYTKA